MKAYHFISAIIGLSGILLLAACNLPSAQQSLSEPTVDLNRVMTEVVLSAPTEAVPTEEPTPVPTVTPEPLKTLTVCLGKEPETLFFYQESSQAMWSVLESIYNGPFDYANGEAVPVIFENIAVEKEPVTVKKGDVVVDTDQSPVELKNGVSYLPSDCEGADCVQTWAYTSETAKLDQTVITFRLKENLTWSDGTPLTAEDSVYSMTLNGTKGIQASRYFYNRTESYTAADEHTVIWRGLPGFSPEDPSDVFWIPLPRHQMQGMSVEALTASEAVSRSPLGWGAWKISSWEKGSQIIADRNPYYQSADGTLPYFDQIIYKFYGKAGDNNLEALHSGGCDIIDTSVDLSVDLEPILEDVRDGKEAVYIQPKLTRQELSLNLAPLTWNNSKIFSSTELRTAIAQCINRPAINRQVLYGQSEVPVDFYPADYKDHQEGLEALAYDPEKSKEVLTTLGWELQDNGSGLVRTARQVAGIPMGTELRLQLLTSESSQAQKTAEMVRENLGECGIEVEIVPQSLGTLYAQGPEGAIFGRTYDAALFSWASSTQSDPCKLYLSDQIPSETNQWIGTNVGGYQNPDYDAACLYPESAETSAAALYAEEFPVIPLYFDISIAVSDLHICGMSDTIGSRSVLWNLEQLSRSEETCAVSQWHNIYQ